MGKINKKLSEFDKKKICAQHFLYFFKVSLYKNTCRGNINEDSGFKRMSN